MPHLTPNIGTFKTLTESHGWPPLSVQNWRMNEVHGWKLSPKVNPVIFDPDRLNEKIYNICRDVIAYTKLKNADRTSDER